MTEARGAEAEAPMRSARRRRGAGGQAYAIIVLAAWVPVAFFVVDNAAKLFRPLPLLVLGGALSAVGAAVVAIVGRRRGRPAAQAAAAGGATVIISFFMFGRLVSVEPTTTSATAVGLLLFVVLTGLVAFLAARLSSTPGFRQFLVIALATVLLVGGLGLGSAVLARRGIEPLPGTTMAGPAEAASTPNVYWFVLDEFARTDQLLAFTGYDNGWFDEALRERGFTVSTSSTSAYPHTHLSLASTLLMDYPFTDAGALGETTPHEFDLVSPVISGENPVVERFEALGYSFVYANAGPYEWGACDTALAAVCLAPEGDAPWWHDPLRGLLATTPLALLGAPGAHTTPGGTLDRLDSVRAEIEPFFLFAHVLSPHQPFRYEADCSARAVWVEGTRMSGAERAAAYANEVRCLSGDLVLALDRIIASDPDAIIVVQSDHGSKLSVDWDRPMGQWSDESLDERFSVLNAQRLPEACADGVEGAPLVNTFRIVLACIGGVEPELLPARSFFTGFEDLGSLAEVTDRIG